MPRLPAAVPYDDFGTNMRVWQIDFTQLNLTVQGGVKYRFGAWGLGRAQCRTKPIKPVRLVQCGDECTARRCQPGRRRRRDAAVHFRRQIQERLRWQGRRLGQKLRHQRAGVWASRDGIGALPAAMSENQLQSKLDLPRRGGVVVINPADGLMAPFENTVALGVRSWRGSAR